MPRDDDDSGEFEATRRRRAADVNRTLYIILGVAGVAVASIALLCGGALALSVFGFGMAVKHVADNAEQMQQKVQAEQARVKAEMAEVERKQKEDIERERNAPVFDRDEFVRAVTGKTREEVRGLYGPPRSTIDAGGMGVWVYDRKTRDPATGRVSPAATLHFRDGKVALVQF